MLPANERDAVTQFVTPKGGGISGRWLVVAVPIVVLLTTAACLVFNEFIGRANGW
jgi:hypothetical protein